VARVGSAARPGGFFGGDGRGVLAQERSTWVTQACTPLVDVFDGLYDCAGAAGDV